MKENLKGTILGLGAFLTVCLLSAFLLVAVFAQLRFSEGNTYYAEFTNVTTANGAPALPPRAPKATS